MVCTVVTLRFIGFYWVLQYLTEFYCFGGVLLGLTVFFWVLLGFTRFN